MVPVEMNVCLVQGVLFIRQRVRNVMRHDDISGVIKCTQNLIKQILDQDPRFCVFLFYITNAKIIDCLVKGKKITNSDQIL